VSAYDASSPGDFDRNDRDLATSDRAGNFTIPAVAPGSYRVVAKDETHAPGTSDLFAVERNRPTTGVIVVLPAAATIRGVVVASDGNAVPYATVRVSGTTWSADMVNRQAAADDHGTFVIAGLPRKHIQLRAESETAASNVVDVDLVAHNERTDVRIILDQTGSISGVVMDSSGQPVAEASVSAVPDFLSGDVSGSDLLLASTSAATTDGGGGFTLRGLQDGKYRLAASRDGHGERLAWGVDAVVATTGAIDVRITIPTPGGLRGTVAFASGDAPPMAVISAGGEHRVTTRSGEFELGGMRPGKYDLRVTGPDFAEVAKGDLVVTDGKTTEVGTVTVTAGRKASGRVVDSKGAPVVGAKVMVAKMIFGNGKQSGGDNSDNDEESAGMRSAITTSTGEFVVRGISKTSGVVVAEDPDRGRSIAIPVSAGDTDVGGLELTLRGYGALTGIVTRKGQPVSGATINAAPLGGTSQAVFVTAGPDGKFVLDKVPEGPTAVQAMQTGMMSAVSASKTVAVVAGRSVDASIDIPAGDIALTVKVDPEPGATVNAAWLLLMRGAFAATNGQQLMDAFLASKGSDGGAAGMQIWLGTPTFPTFDELVAGTYSVCAIPITGSLLDSQLMDRVQEHLSELDAVCKGVVIPARPVKQDFTLVVPQMKALPAPGESPKPSETTR
jgi:Carboxypeptidase regulatory-like domain